MYFLCDREGYFDVHGPFSEGENINCTAPVFNQLTSTIFVEECNWANRANYYYHEVLSHHNPPTATESPQWFVFEKKVVLGPRKFIGDLSIDTVMLMMQKHGLLGFETLPEEWKGVIRERYFMQTFLEGRKVTDIRMKDTIAPTRMVELLQSCGIRKGSYLPIPAWMCILPWFSDIRPIVQEASKAGIILLDTLQHAHRRGGRIIMTKHK